MNSGDVITLLRERFSDRDRYVYAEEVQLGASRIDVVVMSCYRCDGYELAAFEIKVSRPDWLRELRDPSKNSAWRKHAGSFSYVATSGVILPGEIPQGLGWMRATSSGLRWKAKPTVQAITLAPEMVVAIARSAVRLAVQMDREKSGLVSRS